MQPTELLRDALPLAQDPQADRAQQAERAEDRQLAAMSFAFQRHEGMATTDEVVRLIRRRSDQPISALARWIAYREIVHFAWQGSTLLPLFQFDRSCMEPNPIVTGVVRELRDAFDDWAIALWFATPNAGTNGAAPVDAFECDPLAALAAARADRLAALERADKRKD